MKDETRKTHETYRTAWNPHTRRVLGFIVGLGLLWAAVWGGAQLFTDATQAPTTRPSLSAPPGASQGPEKDFLTASEAMERSDGLATAIAFIFASIGDVEKRGPRIADIGDAWETQTGCSIVGMTAIPLESSHVPGDVRRAIDATAHGIQIRGGSVGEAKMRLTHVEFASESLGSFRIRYALILVQTYCPKPLSQEGVG